MAFTLYPELSPPFIIDTEITERSTAAANTTKSYLTANFSKFPEFVHRLSSGLSKYLREIAN